MILGNVLEVNVKLLQIRHVMQSQEVYEIIKHAEIEELIERD